MLYTPARFEPVSAEQETGDEALEGLRKDTVKRSGLLLHDLQVLDAMESGGEKRYIPIKLKKDGTVDSTTARNLATMEQLGALSRYIEKTLREMVEQLRLGSVATDPWFKNAADTACRFCEYRQACMFDEERDGWRVRSTRMDAAGAWEIIMAEADKQGGQMA